MTEKENFLRIVKNIYDNISPINYLDDFTKLEKLNELSRWIKDFKKQTDNVETMLNTFISLGILNESDRAELIEKIKEINEQYLKI
ncbi:hypothetical protein [Chryseobacterium gambrini]|uniref:hypothetical protein n=1 Tax=Chryseobacterium gambrini TaxID=373672 RepID=UPI0022F1C478|nr:hypothetical protein [Chryseobacterium gambrini]WBV54167.1 hypothetical protein PFY09_07510 [Chryseobacterium gambrini]